MNKYKSLAKNTLIFAIGTFGSKILSFIMVFFYSRAMSTAEFGLLDIIINSASLVIPIAFLGITNAVIRFGLDDEYKQSDVFTTGILSVGLGFGFLLLLSPFVMMIEDLKNYIVVFYLHILMSALRHVCSFFVRSDNRPKLYAADGIFSTFMTCLLTIIFLIPLKMGIVGYMLAIIIADFLSVLFLIIGSRAYKNLNFRTLNKTVCKRMISFSLPLMPTSLLWWVVNVSDRYFVKYMIGSAANGLYAAAYKIPTILTLVSAIFLDAWQISAVNENKSTSKNEFYSDIFKSFQGGIFVVGSVLIFASKLVTKLLLADSYYDSWQYIPVLIFATVFSCFVVFMGNIYLALKRNIATLVTTIAGAVINLILNGIFISLFGAQGAAIATCISYFTVYLARAIDIKHKEKNISFSTTLVFINSVIMLAQTVIMLLEVPYWWIWQTVCLLLTVLVNYKMLLDLARKILKKD